MVVVLDYSCKNFKYRLQSLLLKIEHAGHGRQL